MHLNSLLTVVGSLLWHATNGKAARARPGGCSGNMPSAAFTAGDIPTPQTIYAPLPTLAPAMGEFELELRKREDIFGDICGYVSGDAREFSLSPRLTLLS